MSDPSPAKKQRTSKSEPSPEKKQRTPRTAKKDKPTIAAVDAESIQLTKTLKEHYIGSIKIPFSRVTTEWKDSVVQNRALSTDAIATLVKTFEQVGIDRIEPSHHMSVTIKDEYVTTFLSALGFSNKEELIKQNDVVNYPLLTRQQVENANLPRFILLAGQHRFAALKKSFPTNEGEWWWVAKVYTESLPISASETLKLNKKTVQTELSKGDQFVSLVKLAEEIAEKGKKKATMTEEELGKLSDLEAAYAKTKQAWGEADSRAKQVM